MKTSEMTSRERVRTAIERMEPDRVPVYDDIWSATVKRWQREGFPEETSPADYFGFDMRGISADLTPRYPVRVLEKNEEYVVETTRYGGVRRNHRDYSTTPEIIDYRIKTKDDWLEVKQRLTPSRDRVNWKAVAETAAACEERQLYLFFSAVTGYDLICYYMRSDQALMAMVEDPEWFKEMVDVSSELVLETLKMIYEEGIRPDALWVFNDMGYKYHGFFSPEMYRELIAPSDSKRNEWCHEHGMQTILHSCGYVEEFIPDLIAAGFDCLQPIEVKAGMDMARLKREYGDRIALFGGINVVLMTDPDPSKIEAEIKRVFDTAKPGGGYLYHSDHSIPKDVSFERYRFIMDCVRRYGEY